jgi:hypothetical protein
MNGLYGREWGNTRINAEGTSDEGQRGGEFSIVDSRFAIEEAVLGRRGVDASERAGFPRECIFSFVRFVADFDESKCTRDGGGGTYAF